jgi:hypothetical protein
MAWVARTVEGLHLLAHAGMGLDVLGTGITCRKRIGGQLACMYLCVWVCMYVCDVANDEEFSVVVTVGHLTADDGGGKAAADNGGDSSTSGDGHSGS